MDEQAKPKPIMGTPDQFRHGGQRVNFRGDAPPAGLPAIVPITPEDLAKQRRFSPIDYSIKEPWLRGCCPSPDHQRQCQEAGGPLISLEGFRRGCYEPACPNARECSAEPICVDFYKAIMAAPVVENAREQGGRLLGYAMDPTTRQFYAVLILDQRLVRQSTRIAYGE
jgi:hypothetical protein